MSWLQKLFGKEEAANASQPFSPGEPSGADPIDLPPFTGLEGIRFGHYSDNNKTYAQIQQWHTSEQLFKAQDYAGMFIAFFDYLRDPEEGNVVFTPDGASFTFSLTQGSRRIEGSCDGKQILVSTPLAIMDAPSTAVMRRLLDLNFRLSYCRCALNDAGVLYMMMDSPVPMASPTRLYYSLKELATRADRQDDLLVADFATLRPATGDEHRPLPSAELEVKFTFFQKWIRETLERAAALNADSFAGAIAYLFLTLIYRIDFLVAPEATLLTEIEHIHSLYWEKKEEVSLVERNQKMKEAVTALLDITIESFAASVYTSEYTFAAAAPARSDKIREQINAANKESRWYVDNQHPELAQVLVEYGVTYSIFTASMPAVFTALTIVFMAVQLPDYFTALGMQAPVYNEAANTFNQPAIRRAIDEAIEKYGEKYTDLKWDHSRINWTGRYEFGLSFTEQMAGLNLEQRR